MNRQIEDNNLYCVQMVDISKYLKPFNKSLTSQEISGASNMESR